MKILFVANGITGDNPGLSGGEIRFIEIAKAWSSWGHEIHLMSSPQAERLCEKLGLRVILHHNSDHEIKGRLVFILKAIKSIFFLPKSLKDFEGIVYSTNEMVFDILPALRLKWRKKKKIRWATVVHWLPPFPPWKRRESALINATLFFINERISLWLSNWFADVLLPVSAMTAKQLKSLSVYQKKIKIVECGVNFEQIRAICNVVKHKKYDAVFMKRLQAVKGVFDLIEIWEIVIMSLPKARLLIIGEGIDGEKAKQIVKYKGLENNINFAGMIFDVGKKFRMLSESKLFILPTYEENWAIVIGEAMAAGIPVVSYGLKELLDVWEDNFISVPLGDKVYFANKVVELLKSPDVGEEYAKKALAYVKRYDWGEIAEREFGCIISNSNELRSGTNE